MSLITTLRAPGTGRRQAEPNPRLVAENARLRDQLDQAHAELRHTASVLGEFVVMLGEEQAEHYRTREARDLAVRANEANANAETVQTDVTALRAAMADEYVEPDPAGPAYAQYRPIVSPTIRVVPLWVSPQAAHPANIPAVTP